MNTEHQPIADWPHLLAWFERVVDTPPAQREALLQAAAEEAPALRAQLERLLALDASTHDIGADAADWRERMLNDDAPPPAQIGPWRIVRELGAGEREASLEFSRA
ncbi:MAG: hypothetical protein L0H70_10275, partial [Xanthomonadales bacterium]|nr:hypothetical protein [Xanthomonadales bacterium]